MVDARPTRRPGVRVAARHRGVVSSLGAGRSGAARRFSREGCRATTHTPRWSTRSRPPRRHTPTSWPCRRSGRATSGRDLWVAKVSDDVATDEARARGPVRRAPPRPGASLARAEPGDPALADRRYGTDATSPDLVDSREIWIILAVNPDGAQYDLTGSPYRAWRKNRQPNPASSAIGTDLNRNYGYHWGCCGGSSGNPSLDTYRGPTAFSTPETRAIRDFIASRRIGGRQQIKTAITFHTAGRADPVAVRLYANGRPGRHDRCRSRALVALGQEDGDDQRLHGDAVEQPLRDRRRRDRLGVWDRARSSCTRSSCTRVHAKVSSTKRFYPADELIGPRDGAQPGGDPDADRRTPAVPTRWSGPTQRELRAALSTLRDGRRLGRSTRTGPTPRPPGPGSAPTRRPRHDRPGPRPPARGRLVTGCQGRAEGRRPRPRRWHDERSLAGRSHCPGTVGTLTFRYYLAHSADATAKDYFRAYVEGRTAPGRWSTRSSGAGQHGSAAWTAVSACR